MLILLNSSSRNEIYDVFENGNNTDNEEYKYDYREDISHIDTHPLFDLKTFALICFAYEVIPPPGTSVLESTEQNKSERS